MPEAAPEQAAPGPFRRQVAVAGHLGEEHVARAALADGDAGVRASALTALARLGVLGREDVREALADGCEGVRRRACELAGRYLTDGAGPDLVGALCDSCAQVVEASCYALGEMGAGTAGACQALAHVATGHPEALCREAAVAALGSLGDPEGLGAVLAACADKPAVRRRAVVALAAFDGEVVDEALARAVEDPDWQVRQAAEDLLGRTS